MGLDSILNSSMIVYILLALFVFHVYLRRTHQTAIEVFKRIKEFFQEMNEEKKHE